MSILSTKKILWIWFSVVLLIGIFVVHAQSSGRHIMPAENWHQLTNDHSFNYKNEIESAPVRKSSDPGLLARMLMWIAKWIVSDNGIVFLWTLVGLVAVYVIYMIIKNREGLFFARRSKVLGDIGATVSEDIALVNWGELMQKALADNDLKNATRYGYMLVLQMLMNRQLIDFRPDKTNYEYYCELNDPEIKRPFRKLSLQYEYVWYGDFVADQNTINNFMEVFRGLQNRIR